MSSLQVHIDEETHKALRRKVASLGITVQKFVAALVQKAVKP